VPSAASTCELDTFAPQSQPTTAPRHFEQVTSDSVASAAARTSIARSLLAPVNTRCSSELPRACACRTSPRQVTRAGSDGAIVTGACAVPATRSDAASYAPTVICASGLASTAVPASIVRSPPSTNTSPCK
jgi:hypothetical protein